MQRFIVLLLLFGFWFIPVDQISAQFSSGQSAPAPGTAPAAPPGAPGQAPGSTPGTPSPGQPAQRYQTILPFIFPSGQPQGVPGSPPGQQSGGIPSQPFPSSQQPPSPALPGPQPPGLPPQGPTTGVPLPGQVPSGEIPQPSLEGQPPTQPGEAPPPQTVGPGEIPSALPAEPLSAIEATFTGQVPQTQAVPLRQFGYDLFRSARGFLAPVDLPVGPDYILGPGDSLLVRSWGSFFFDYNLPVARNGQIFLPEIGPVQVAGLRFDEVERLIRQAFSAKYQDVQLSITLGQLRSITVFVVGEVGRPGSYQLSSLSTVLHALFAAEGPTKQGSLRRIQLSRGKRIIAEIDLYRLLLEGDQSQDHRLQSGDTLFVPLIGKVAGIAGNVKRPAIYELKAETSLQELIAMAGGVTPFAYTQTIQVERAQENERKIILDLNLDQALRPGGPARSLMLQDADLVRISRISALVQNQVELVGNVERPGRYEFKKGMRVSDLLELGRQLLPETYMPRAEIERLVPPDNHTEIVAINLGALLRGDKSQDLLLQEQDRVLIYSVYSFQDFPLVQITGAVRRPGQYRLFQGMTIRDLIFRAGGLSSGAYTLQAELNRIVFSGEAGDSKIASNVIIPIRLDAVLKGDPIANISLQERDALFIRFLPEWNTVDKVVHLSGEFRFPGQYVILPGERLSSVIRRAGGFTAEAFPQGAIFTRESVQRQQEQQFREVLELIQIQTLQSEVETAGISIEEQRAASARAVSAQRRLLELLAAKRPTGRMVVRLTDPEKLEGTNDDVELQAGDSIYVPSIPSSVNVTGGVFQSGAVVFREGAGLDYYIQRVGGLTEIAVEDEIRLIKANGTVVTLNNGRGNPFFGRSRFSEDRVERIERGDTIFVPVKFKEELPVLSVTQAIVDIMFKTAVIVATTVAAF